MCLSNRRDIRTVQALRSLACALVVAYHAAGCWGQALLPPRDADAVWPNGAAGVDLFFVVSGFVMAQAGAGLSGPEAAWRFAVRRCRRLVPLYWLMTGAKLALLAATGAGLWSIWHLVASLLLIPARDGHGAVRPVLGVGWSLQFECLFYALFALSLALRKPPARVLLPVLIPLAVAGFFRSPAWPAVCVLANGLVLEFCLGLAVAWACKAWRPATAVAAGLATAGILLLLTCPQPGPWRFLAWGVPAALVLAGAVWLEPACGARLPRWLLAAGDASYATYLLHPFLVPLLAWALLPPAPDLSRLWLLAGLSVGAGTLSGAALHRWIDRPIQRRLASARRGRASLGATMPQFVQP